MKSNEHKIDAIIEEKIELVVAQFLYLMKEELADLVLDRLERPNYMTWGKFLSPKQARNYTGYKSMNAFKEMCKSRGIKPIKINDRVLRYDRNDLDRLNIKEEIKEYISRL